MHSLCIVRDPLPAGTEPPNSPGTLPMCSQETYPGIHGLVVFLGFLQELFQAP